MHVNYFTDVEHESGKITRFHALDKIGKNRTYMSYYNFEGNRDEVLTFDPEWLTITKMMENLIPNNDFNYEFENFLVNVAD